MTAVLALTRVMVPFHFFGALLFLASHRSLDMDVDSDEEEEKVKTETHTGGRMGGMMARKVFKNKKTEESESEEEDILERLTKDFGYDMGYTYTLEEYKVCSFLRFLIVILLTSVQGMADLFAARWADTCSTIHDKEREYWRIVEGGSVRLQFCSLLFSGLQSFPFRSGSMFSTALISIAASMVAAFL